MNIVIDTNIIRKDFKMRDANFEVMLDYLEKSKSQLILPRIVLQETLGLYKRVLTEKIIQYKKGILRLNGTLVDNLLNEPVKIDIDERLEAYQKFLVNYLRIELSNIFDYKGEYLEDIARRAINRQKPLGKDGQQFRDGILWLSVLDIAKDSPEKSIFFISENTNDFGTKEREGLISELKEEADIRGVRIIYVSNLSEFSKLHASRISFITEKWIKNEIDYGILKKLFNSQMPQLEDQIVDAFDFYLDTGESNPRYVGDYGAEETIQVESFYVNELQGNKVVLNIIVTISKELEMEVEKEIEVERDNIETHWHLDHKTGELIPEPLYTPKYTHEEIIEHQFYHPEFRCEYQIVISGDQIISYDLNNLELM